MKQDKFWIVWNEDLLPEGSFKKHGSLELAMKEAERLANNHHGSTFHVLEIKGSCKYATIHWIEYSN